MSDVKTDYKFLLPSYPYFTVSSTKKETAVYHRRSFLLLAEGHAVGALILSGVALVGAHHDLIQRAVVLLFPVMCTLVDGAFDGLVGMAVHSNSLL